MGKDARPNCLYSRGKILVYTGCQVPHVPNRSQPMSDQKRIWRIVVPLALLLLVLGTTFGMVWHHHDNSSVENCPLCHLTIAPSLAGVRACTLVLVGAGPKVHYT